MVLWLPGLMLVGLACGAGRPETARHVAVTTGEHVRATSGSASGVRPVDRSAFSRGACMAYAPKTGPARPLTVFLDAGHGGRDPGAVGRTQSGQPVHEADQALAVELDTMRILRAAGFRVVVSRTHNTSVMRLRPDDVSGAVLTVEGSHQDVLARAVCANDAHANVLVGIYFDAGAPSNAGSVTAYDAVRPFAARNRRLAELLQRDVLGAMNAQGWRIPNGGVKSDVTLGTALTATALAYGHLVLLGPAYRGYVSTPSRMPGALIEPLFITDPFEGTIAASHHGQEVIARAIAKAIEQYFAQGT